jgi:hypothetical protein
MKTIKDKIVGKIIRTYNKKGRHIKSSFPDVAKKLEEFLGKSYPHKNLTKLKK